MSGARTAGASRAGAEGDAYLRHLRSEAYRRERADKAEVILALCGKELERGGRVADIGAGTGLIKKALEEELDTFLFGFELDRDFIVYGAGMAVADATCLPVRGGTFDFLLLNHLYEHVADQEGLFREAFRALSPGGVVYVAAGNRLMVMEPHYRLPFLSWLPRWAAHGYLRLAGRGRRYEGIRFRTRSPLVRMMEKAGFEVEDRTEAASRLTRAGKGSRWRRLARILGLLPGPLRRTLLHWMSPQWFFLLRRPPENQGGEPSRPKETG